MKRRKSGAEGIELGANGLLEILARQLDLLRGPLGRWSRAV